MSNKTFALIVLFSLFLLSTFAYGQENRIVYPQVSIGPLPQQSDSPDLYPYFDRYFWGTGVTIPKTIEIELRLGNLSATDAWHGEIRLLRKVDLVGMDNVFVTDGDGNYTLAEDGVYAVEIPAGGAGVYCITSDPLQYGVLVVEAMASRIEDLNTSVSYKTRWRHNDVVTDLEAVQPATAPSTDFRGMVTGTDELDYPFANLDSGFAVVSERALSGSPGTTEVDFAVILEGDETEYSGTITLGGDEPELQSLMLRDVIDGLPPSFKVGQLELSATEPVYLSMVGVGSPPVFTPHQFTSTPAQPFVSSAPKVGEPSDPSVGQFQYKDLVIRFDNNAWSYWNWLPSYRSKYASAVWKENLNRFDSDYGTPLSLWHPFEDKENGFYLVGDIAIGCTKGVNDECVFEGPPFVAMVKDANGDRDCTDLDPIPENRPALCPPVNFELVWFSEAAGESFAHWGRKLWLYRPIPPSGYKCLGLIGEDSESGEDAIRFLDVWRCVRQDLVAPAFQGRFLWNTKGVTYDSNPFWLRHISPGDAGSGEVFLSPGTFTGAVGVVAINPPRSPVMVPYALRFSVEEIVVGDLPDVPVLTSYDPLVIKQSPTVTYSTKLPWYLVKDPYYEELQQIEVSPEYIMTRSDTYKLIQWGLNMTNETQSVEWEFTWGVNKTISDEFSRTTGVEFTLSTKIGNELIGMDASYKLSSSFTHTQSTTRGWTEEKTYRLPVNIYSGTAVAAFILQSNYRLLRYDGSQVSRTVPFSMDTIIFTQYPALPKTEGLNGASFVLKDVLKQAD